MYLLDKNMDTYYGLVVLCLCLTISPVELTIPYCTPNNSPPNPSDPKIPTQPKQFQAIVEANFLEENSTSNINEYYDYTLLKGTMVQEKNGVRRTFISDYKSGELFQVTGYLCNVTNLVNGVRELFGTNGPNGYKRMFTPSEMLHVDNSTVQKYIGRSVVRGITVDHWQSCQYWADMSANFTVDYFYTAANWLDPINKPQIPVRAVVKGISTSSGQTKNFSHVYDYIDYRPNVTDPAVFETPSGVLCPGRKQLRPLPTFPNFFHYKSEVISNTGPDIKLYDGWFDGVNNLLRTDQGATEDKTPPLYTLNPVSQITDNNYGITYVKDKVTGECKTIPIRTGKTIHNADLALNTTNRNPLDQVFYEAGAKHFLYLDVNYTYTGQRTTRGLLCDVFIANRTYPQPYSSQTFEYYFLANKYTAHPDDGTREPKDVPIMVIQTSPYMGEKTQINILEFDQPYADLSIFDVSSCYSKSSSLQLNIKFSGHINNKIVSQLGRPLTSNITSAMGISPLRVHAVGINYDVSFIYASIKILDRMSTLAQFNKDPNKNINNLPADKFYTFDKIGTEESCAEACVNSVDFSCLTFIFCPMDKTQACRLFKDQVTSTSNALSYGKCNHYYRGYKAPSTNDINITTAYNNLMSTYHRGGLLLAAYQEVELEPSIYRAVDVSVVWGYLYQPGTPSLDAQFSYHLENSIPNIQQVFNSHIWYDYMYKLVRYDVLKGGPVTIIHDYNSGLAYTINKLDVGCTVEPIGNSSFDVVSPTSAQTNKNGYILQMKNPLQLFYLTNNYAYVGQKTVRSMMCDVYENVGPFNFGGTVKDALFQFYFMTGGWHELSSGSGIPVRSQPISLDITASDGSELEHFDIYDFNQQHSDLSNFDIKSCFQPEQQRNFLITFNQTYHPTLETNLALFQRNVQEQLSVISTVSPLRFQNPEITYQDQVTYYIATMVEQAPVIFDFTKTSGTQSMHLMDASYSKITSASQCAGMCRNATSFACESFDYCSSAKLCVLSKEHTDDGTPLKSSATCDHYSKTVAGKLTIEPTIQQAFTMFQDRIAQGTFVVPVQINSSLTVRFPAVHFDRHILITDYYDSSSTTLNHFTRFNKKAMIKNPQLKVKKVAVDGCAKHCLNEPTFECQGFSYSPRTGFCLLSSSYPSQNSSNIADSTMYVLYQRKYVDAYVEYPGNVLSYGTGTRLTNIVSADVCAKKCSQSTTIGNTNTTCRSFNYCGNTSTCYLKSTHALDVYNNTLTKSVTCTHYSKKYLYDFKKTPHRILITMKTITYYNVTPDQCAKLCVESRHLQCHTFTYCPVDSTCHLEANQTSLSHPQIKSNQNCDLYTRHTTQTLPSNGPSSQKISKKNSGFGPGALAGVAVGMLVVGVLLGGVLQYFFRTKKLVDRKIQYEMQTVREHRLKEEEDT